MSDADPTARQAENVRELARLLLLALEDGPRDLASWRAQLVEHVDETHMPYFDLVLEALARDGQVEIADGVATIRVKGRLVRRALDRRNAEKN